MKGKRYRFIIFNDIKSNETVTPSPMIVPLGNVHCGKLTSLDAFFSHLALTSRLYSHQID